jgi:hypothetical protein
MVWKPQNNLTQANALEMYIAIAEGKVKLADDPALHAFIADLFAQLPPLEVNEESPWSVTPYVSEGHVAIGVSGNIINISCHVVDLAFRHGLVVYHPEIDKLYDAAWDEMVKKEGLENRRRAGEIE